MGYEFQEAEEMNRRFLEKREQVLGKKHLDTLASVDNLALSTNAIIVNNVSTGIVQS